MRLAITDANIFIDLIHIGFVDHLFSIGFEIHTCAEVLAELNERQQDTLKDFSDRKVLTVHIIHDDAQEIGLFPVPKSLSNTDVTVIFLARKLDAMVLSGDGVLRRHCEKEKIDVRGILWLLDLFIEKRLTTHANSVTQLEKLMSYNDRLPKNECERRLQLWRNAQ